MKRFTLKFCGKRAGFTLTEVLVVVLVIAVLSAIVYPMYTKAVTKTKAVEAINLLEMVRNKQLAKFARDRDYYANVNKLGQITSAGEQEALSEDVLKINDYTLSLNTSKKCVTASYNKGRIKFSFSSGYETSGLGCSGDICSSFGNIVGSSETVCGCGNTCPSGFIKDEETCECKCNLCLINGSCMNPAQNQETTRSCGNGGIQTRTCAPDCNGGNCGSWGACTGQNCSSAGKPVESQACGNCGTQTRTVTCDAGTGSWITGTWGACIGGGVCAPGATQNCNGTGTQICSSSCTWGGCNVANCDNGSKPVSSQTCGNCNKGSQTRTVSCNTSNGTWTVGQWSACTGGGECQAGSDNCDSNCKCSSGYSSNGSTCEKDSVECPASSKPAASAKCGNCGIKTQTVTCDTSTGKWTEGGYGKCTGEGVCASGATQSCNGTGTQTCSSSCSWGDCACPSGSTFISEASRCCTAKEVGLDTRDGGCCVELPNCGKQINSTTVGACQCIHDELQCVGSSSQACGKCGTQTRVCNTVTGEWGSWSACKGERGVCTPGESIQGEFCDTSICVNWRECVKAENKFCTSNCQWEETKCVEWAGDCCCGRKPGADDEGNGDGNGKGKGHIEIKRQAGVSCAEYFSHSPYKGYISYGCACSRDI